ncbi:hypothetical protein EV361DRAFT_922116 [Lentinula raphanica]|nr:hypothetical protein EV361DRAFT_922116 [Lentinula raphanica]
MTWLKLPLHIHHGPPLALCLILPETSKILLWVLLYGKAMTQIMYWRCLPEVLGSPRGIIMLLALHHDSRRSSRGISLV